MKYLKYLVLIFFALFTVFLSEQNRNSNYSTTINHQNSIFSYSNPKHSVIAHKNNSIKALRQELMLSNSVSRNSSFSSNNPFFEPEWSQKQGLISYIYNKSFLSRKDRIALSAFLLQIQPNAP